MLTLSEIRTAFGEWVLEVLRKHGASYRSQRIRTGIPHSTVVNWATGSVPPQMEGVIAFARGFNEDVNEALALAGYERIESPSDTLLRGWDAICEEHPALDIPFPLKAGGVKGLTQENAEDILTEIRRKISLGMYPVKRDAAAVRD